MKIVYVGLLFEGSSAAFRADSLRQLGHEIVAIDTTPSAGGVHRFVRGFRRRTGLGPAHALNRQMVSSVERASPDLLWVDKGLHVTAGALASSRRKAGALRIVHYSLDDYRIPGNRSVDMLRALREYDLVVTTKTFNVAWLRSHGARRVLMSWQGFDSAVHRPADAGETDRSLEGRIVFIGGWEEDRARIVGALGAAGLPVSVLSPQPEWASVASRYPSVHWKRGETYGRAYAVALGSAAIGLGVLRKKATDLHTQRSVEIPACGTALLAERTDEHLALFKEGEEAEFFASDAECVEKARVLLGDPQRRARVATAGRRRCLEGHYSWTDRVSEILRVLEEGRDQATSVAEA